MGMLLFLEHSVLRVDCQSLALLFFDDREEKKNGGGKKKFFFLVVFLSPVIHPFFGDSTRKSVWINSDMIS
jgi:hypothetical protein